MNEMAFDFIRLSAAVGCLALSLALVRTVWRLLTWSRADLIRWAYGDKE